jgi:hypothetical protein
MWNPDVTTAVVTQAQAAAGLYAPLFRIRIASEGLPTNGANGYLTFRVIAFSANETFTKDCSLLVTDAITSDCRLIDLKYREQIISVFAHNDGTYVTVYAKCASSYGYPLYCQYLFAPNKAFIEDLPVRDCSVDKTAIVGGTIITAATYPAPNMSFESGWTTNIDTTYTTKNTEIIVDFDRVYVNAAITGGTYTDGTIIGFITPLPQGLPRRFIAHTIAADGTIGHCTITIDSSNDIRIYGATTNNLVLINIWYGIYY